MDFEPYKKDFFFAKEEEIILGCIKRNEDGYFVFVPIVEPPEFTARQLKKFSEFLSEKNKNDNQAKDTE